MSEIVQLSELGAVIRAALVKLTGSDRLPIEAIDALADQLLEKATLADVNAAKSVANDAKVTAQDALDAANGMTVSGEAVRTALDDGEGLPVDLVKAAEGYAILQVNTGGMGLGSEFHFSLVSDDGRTVLASAVVDTPNPALPAQMVSGTNFSAPMQFEEGQRIDVNIFAAPASSQPVTAYRIMVDGAGLVVEIPASQPMPYSLSFTPALYPEIWQWAVASWNAYVRVAAVSSAGVGAASAASTVAVDQDDSYFVPGDDWTLAEERDGTISGSVVGLPRATLDVSRVIPADMEAFVYLGPLTYAPANLSAIQAAAVAIAPGGNILGATGAAVGETQFAILLYREAGGSIWHQASEQKSFTVQGLIPSGAPAVVTAPAITSAALGKIGTAHAVSNGTWTNSPTGYTYEWLRDRVVIPGATASSYTPVPDDDLTKLACRVKATNATGTTSYVTADVSITYAAPTLGGSISDQTLSQESGSYESVDISGVFSGSGYTVSVAGPKDSGGADLVTYNADEQTLSINVSEALASTAVTVTATNSGGSVSDSFNLAVTAVGTAAVPSVRAVGGSNTAGSADFTDYATDSMILAAVRFNSAGGFSVPDLSGSFSGQYLWNVLINATSSGQSQAIAWRRCASDGADGALGDWGDGRPTYISIDGVDWSDPIGANTLEGTPSALTWQSGGLNLDHPGLTLEGANSIVLDIAFHATAQTAQAPGLRPDATLVVQSTNGIRKTISRSTAAPATAWAAADDVPHTVTTAGSGVQFVAAVEIKGSEDASGLTWPADVPDAKWAVSEVTDPAVATAQGFGGESGHLKMTTTADITVTATTASGDFTLRREIMSGEEPAPSADGVAVTASLTYYTTGKRPVGGKAYPRLWWVHDSSGQMRLAGSKTPFDIVGLSTPAATSFPVPFATGTGTNQARNSFYRDTSGFASTRTAYDSSTGIGTRGSIGPVAGYAALAGDANLRALALKWLRSCLVGSACPPAVASYGAQHEIAFTAAAVFARYDPNQWGDLTSAEKNKVTLLVKAQMIAGAVVARDDDSATWGDMLGYANPTNFTSRANFRCPPRWLVTIGACFFGGGKAGDDVLKSVNTTAKVQAFYDELNNAGLTNAAKSFAPTRPNNGKAAPTYAQIANRCAKWDSGGLALTDLVGITCRELDYCFGQKCQNPVQPNKGDFNGRGKIKGTATGALNALTAGDGQTGMHDDMDGVDAEGPRSSMEYAASPWRAGIYALLAGLVSGAMSRTDPKVIESAARLKVANAFTREITRDKVGWLDFAHDTRNGGDGSNSKNWTWTERVLGSSYLYGLLPWFSMADCAVAIVEGKSTVTEVPASYFTS
ncbi:hypothetical protein [Amaricoccus solimangrovi]|uniref:Ig-like domain-containing protein n=1 Tax=Amaricoccus solimangrovi TaxID=2589815 RepID=A0A501WTM1_9RHOB|nr:hypothetical protein [Amaricoccus solimangrovi]TPE53083.1 hypothetical protein FJM51_03405 [Amaricoccus solimangrovi]